MTTQNEERDVFQTHCFDPFPEPQTIPAGWDMSALLPAPEPAPGAEADDAADSESNY
jgi:hypothetical protein